MGTLGLNHDIHLLNSANVWASTEEELRALCHCTYTSAVTIRTSLLNGFAHDEAIHRYRFLDTETMRLLTQDDLQRPHKPVETITSINTLGYSPIALSEYIKMVRSMEHDRVQRGKQQLKEIIFSVTGSVQEVGLSYLALQESGIPNVSVEVNLSCPNIPGKPPPAYSKPGLIQYLEELKARRSVGGNNDIAIGLKMPPYTYQDQFDDVMLALLAVDEPKMRHPVDFITTTNTLGCCLILPPHAVNETDRLGPGGLGGAAIHSLSLGNVFKLRQLLDRHDSLSHIQIVGVGGVSSGAGYQRMISAGAQKVAIGTALGAMGLDIFDKVYHEVKALQMKGTSQRAELKTSNNTHG